MNINPLITRYYEQKPHLPVPAKQTQSKSIKPNPATVFELKIGFTAIYFRKAYGKTPKFKYN